MKFRNPKQTIAAKKTWYAYYAGYSAGFVEDVVQHFSFGPQTKIVDPWNGSGTTTRVAAEFGLASWGFDINPVMIVVARARLLDNSVQPSIMSLCDDILTKAAVCRNELAPEDPLLTWVHRRTATSIRGLEASVYKLLINSTYRINALDVSGISSLASFFYTALFRTCRQLLLPFESANPTWLRVPHHSEARLQCRKNDIFQVFRKNVQVLSQSLLIDRTSNTCRGNSQNIGNIELASSDNIPLKSSSVDLIIGSPPYCTRIDYAIATQAELALLGFDREYIDTLRRTMIGTPAMMQTRAGTNSLWGQECLDFLLAVHEHPSYASRTYYYKYHLQYFDAMYKTLTELNRILKNEGICTMVVQDSYYKDVHNNLPLILSQMATSFGWRVSGQVDYTTGRTMAHRNVKRHRKHTQVTESALLFKKMSA